jgi:hypothetical protein
MDRQTQLSDLLARYWQLAYDEGKANRTADTPNGDAEKTLSAILALSARPAIDDDAVAALVDLYANGAYVGQNFRPPHSAYVQHFKEFADKLLALGKEG